MTLAAQLWAFATDLVSWRSAVPRAALLFLGNWAVLCTWASFRLADLLGRSSIRRELQVMFVLALLPLPLLDELLARRQFDAACQARAGLTLHTAAARSSAWQPEPVVSEALPGLWLPVAIHRQAWRDRQTGQHVATLTYLQAGGGRLARLAHRPGEPLTFRGECRPKGWAAQV